MDQDVVTLLRAQGGVGAVDQLLAAGCSRRLLERLVRTGVVVRVRRDAVVLAAALRGTTPWIVARCGLGRSATAWRVHVGARRLRSTP